MSTNAALSVRHMLGKAADCGKLRAPAQRLSGAAALWLQPALPAGGCAWHRRAFWLFNKLEIKILHKGS